MFRADCARASSCLEDRGAGRRREDKGPEVLVHLAGLPADAVAVPAPVQPERDRGRVADIRAGALAHTRHIAREQVLNLKLSGEQRRLVDEELRRRGLPGLEEDERRDARLRRDAELGRAGYAGRPRQPQAEVRRPHAAIPHVARVAESRIEPTAAKVVGRGVPPSRPPSAQAARAPLPRTRHAD